MRCTARRFRTVASVGAIREPQMIPPRSLFAGAAFPGRAPCGRNSGIPEDGVLTPGDSGEVQRMAAPAAPAGRSVEGSSRRQLVRDVAGATLASTLQWYDFLLYGYAAAFVLGRLFFPTGDS